MGSFVCPEHGARFDYQGKLTRGPAERDLQRIQVTTKDDRIELIDRL